MSSVDGRIFDLAVVGAGVVGCALARRATLEGAQVVVLERGPDILAGASKANSALLHTGYDAEPGSLEIACVRAGYDEYLEIRHRLGLPVLETDALMAAWTEEEVAALPAMAALARENGVAAEVVDAATVRSLEPNLAHHVAGGVTVPGEHVMDPWSAPLAYLTQAVANGAVVLRNAGLLSASDDGATWSLGTAQGTVRARAVANCAGLQGDRVEQLLLGQASFEIRPRKGQFVVFDKAAFGLIRHVILPVPNERTKGVLLTRTAFGNLLVGPTAEEQQDRERPHLDGAVLRQLVAHGIAKLPALAEIPVTAAYAGLRPATERKEYRVHADAARRVVTAAGIRSTGLTGCLGLARHVWELARGFFPGLSPLAAPLWPAAPNIAETAPRDWQKPGYGEIVCHCELVTRREIEAALEGPLCASDFGGLRRRTRAAMGRCQGFHCLGRLATLTEGRLADPLAIGANRHG